MKIEESMSVEDKARYKLVDTDSYRDVGGDLIAGDDQEQKYKLMVAGEVREISGALHRYKIVSKR